MANNRINYSIGFNVEQTELNRLKTSLQEIMRMTTSDIKKINFDTKDAEGDLKRLKKSAAELSNALKRSTNVDLGTVNLSKFNKELSKLNLSGIYKDMSLAGNAGQAAFRNMTTGALQTNVQLKESNKFLNSMADTMKNTVKWGVASSVMNSFTNSVQQAYGYVKHLDSSLNDIRIVTGYSADEMDRFAEKANKAAKGLAASTTDYTEASLIYYQQGLSGKEVESRAETTLKAANVTGQSAAEVSEQLTAVWNGYKVSAAETEMYVDKLAAVAATTASDLEELSVGMSKVASAAATSGVNMDQLGATLSTVISVTRQAPESVGTAFKTIYARLGDLAVDGEDEFGTKLGEVSNKLKTMGIEILDSQGQMRDMGTVVEEVAEKWDTWSSAQKQAAAVAMAGKRQYNNLMALFENWDMYESALQTSQNSLGTLSEQQEVYLDSAEAKLQQLKTSQEGLYDSLLDADTIKEVAGLLTGLVSGLEHIVDSIGGGSSVLMGFGALLTTVFSKQLTAGLTSAAMNMKKMRVESENLAASKQTIKQFTNALEEIDKGAKDASEKVDTATKNIIQSFAKMLEASEAMSSEEIQNFNRIVAEYNEATDALERYNHAKNTAGSAMAMATTRGAQEGINSKDWAAMERKAASLKDQGVDERKMKELNAHYLKFKNNIDLVNNSLQKEEQEFISIYEKLNKVNQEIQEGVGDTEQLKNKAKQLEESFVKMATRLSNEPLIDGSLTQKNLQIIIKEIKRTGEITDSEIKDIQAAFNTLQQSLKEIDVQLDAVASGKKVGLEKRVNEATGQLKNAGEKATSTIKMEGFVNGLQQVEMFAFGVMAIKNAFKTLGDESLSAGEKIGQVFTGLLMGTTMALPAVIGMRKELLVLTGTEKLLSIETLNVVKAKLADTTATLGQAFANRTLAKDIAKVRAGQMSLAKALLTNPYVLAAIAVAGLGAAMVKLADNALSTEGKLKKAQKATESARKEFEETKSKVDEINSTLSSWEDAAAGMKSLEKGTMEWKQQLIEANNQVLKLLETYPQLYKYIITDEDGLMHISAQGMDLIQEENVKKLESAQLGYAVAQGHEASLEKDRVIEETSSSTQIAESAMKKIFDYAMNNGSAFLAEDEAVLKNTLKEIGVNENYSANIIKHSQEISEALGRAAAHATKAEMHTDTALNSVLKSVDGYEHLTESEKKLARDELKEEGWDDRFQANYQARQNMGDKTIRNDYKNQIGASEWKEDEEGNVEYNIDGVWTAISDTTARMELATKDTSNGFKNLTTDAIETAKALAGLKNEILGNDQNNTKVGDREAISENEAEAIAKGKQSTGINLGQLSDAELTNLDKGTGGDLSDNYIFSDKQVQEAGFEATAKGYQEYIDWLNEQTQKEIERRKAEFESSSKSATNELNKQYDLKDSDLEVKNEDFENAGFSFDDMSNWEGISKHIDENVVSTQGWVEALTQAKEKYQEINKEAEFENTTKGLGETYEQQFGIAAKEYEELATYLHEYGDELEGVSENIEDNAEAAQELAKEMLRYDKAAEAAKESSKEWMKILKGRDIQDKVGILQDLKDAYGNLLDVDGSKFSRDFLENTENLELMQKALNGSEEAYKQLQEAAELDLEKQKFEIDPSINKEAFYEEKAEFENILNEMNFDDLEIGANVNTDKAKAAMEDMINAAHMTEIEAQNYLANMGIDAELEEVEAENEDVHEYTGVQANIKENTRDGVDPVTGNKVEYNFPEVEYTETKPLTTKGKKKTVGTALKVISATKSSGGNFKFKNSTHGGGSKGSGSGGKKGGGGGSKPKRTVKTSEKKRNPYREVDNNIKKLTTSLDRLTEAQDKLFGKQLLNNLNKQLDVIKKQVAETKKKLNLAREEAKAMRTSRTSNYKDENGWTRYNDLKDFGINFNSNGEIANYQSKMKWYDEQIAKYEKQWNNMSAKEQEKNTKLSNRIEALKANRDTLEKLVSEYDTLIYDTIPGLEDELTEALYLEIELKLKKFNLEAEIRLDLTEAIKDWADFKKEMNEYDFYAQGFGGEASQLVKDSSISERKLYETVQSGIGYTLQQDTQTLMDELVKMQSPNYKGQFAVKNPDTGEYVIDEIAVKEAVENNLESLQEYAISIKEATKEAFDNMMEAIDGVDQAYDRQYEVFDFVRGQMESALSMFEMIEGDLTQSAGTGKLEEIKDLYDDIYTNAKQSRQTAQQEMAYWESIMNDTSRTQAEREAAAENYRAAADKLQDALAYEAEVVQKQFELAIDEQIAILNKYLDFPSTSAKWELEMEIEDDYLDTINAAFGKQEFINKVQASINETDSLSAQKRLNKLRDEELAKLREKDKLTQYDLDRANQMLEIELKRIALEEAQLNKSQMRLRRDASGNYSYQFVANEEDQRKAQEELAASQKNLYDLDKENLKNLQNEFAESGSRIADIMNEFKALSPDEQAAQWEDYEAKLNYEFERQKELALQIQETQKNLAQSAFNSQKTLYETNPDAFAGMSEDALNLLGKEFKDLTEEEIDFILKEWAPSSATTLDDMISKVLDPVYEDTQKEILENVKNSSDAYGDSLDAITEEVVNTYESGAEAAENWTKKNEDLIESFKEAVTQTQQIYDNCKKIEQSLDAQLRAVKEMAETIGFEYQNYLKSEANGVGGKTPDKSDETLTLTEEYKKGVAGAIYTFDDDGWGVGNKRKQKLTDVFGSGAASIVDKEVERLYNTNADLVASRYKKYKYQYFDTGGYTGKWGKDGKLAVLHEKELVLNAADTRNILEVISIVRDLVNQKWRNMTGFNDSEISIKMSTLLDIASQILNKVAEPKELMKADSFANAIAEAIEEQSLGQVSRIGSILSSVEQNIASIINNAVFELRKNSIASDIMKEDLIKQNTVDNQVMQQQITINADFPNATSADEIYKAFESLENIAGQRAFGDSYEFNQAVKAYGIR